MMKILNPTVHGVLDYALALTFLMAPRLADFGAPATRLATLIGVVYLGASLFTRYPLGMIKAIPFPLHGIIESILAASWIFMPWAFGFADDAAARNFFVAAGIGLLAVAAITDYQATGMRGYTGEERRRHVLDRRQRTLVVAADRRVSQLDRRSYA
jgi:hypothetical protein